VLLHRSARRAKNDQQSLSEQDALDLLSKVYAKLHADESSDDSFLGDKDDTAFTKLYGESALEAEGYGEITFQGLASLLSAGTARHNSFIDLGSGLGRSVIYACLAGGFTRCDGVELSKERSDRAKLALAQVREAAPWAAERIQLFNGDMLAFGQYFDHDVILANNLLLPDVVQEGIARQFSHIARPGTVLFTTKEVPMPSGVATMMKTAAGVSWQQGGKDFWYKYVKRG
jgi:SAM-dependent methyltransferase